VPSICTKNESENGFLVFFNKPISCYVIKIGLFHILCKGGVEGDKYIPFINTEAARTV